MKPKYKEEEESFMIILELCFNLCLSLLIVTIAYIIGTELDYNMTMFCLIEGGLCLSISFGYTIVILIRKSYKK